MTKEIIGAELDFDKSKGRYVVLNADGKKILQVDCWTDAKRATDNLAGGTCWRLSVVFGGAALKVRP